MHQNVQIFLPVYVLVLNNDILQYTREGTLEIKCLGVMTLMSIELAMQVC